MKHFEITLRESRKRWRPKTEAEKVCQIIGASHGYQTASSCRTFSDAAKEIMGLLQPPEQEAKE